MKAVASVTFDDEFVVHDIKVIEGQNGFFIAMPSRKMGEGDFRDIAHPLTSETRNRIKDAIFEAYDKALEWKGEAEPENRADEASIANGEAAETIGA
jgi:stage V sporulation protein G